MDRPMISVTALRRPHTNYTNSVGGQMDMIWTIGSRRRRFCRRAGTEALISVPSNQVRDIEN